MVALSVRELTIYEIEGEFDVILTIEVPVSFPILGSESLLMPFKTSDGNDSFIVMVQESLNDVYVFVWNGKSLVKEITFMLSQPIWTSKSAPGIITSNVVHKNGKQFTVPVGWGGLYTVFPLDTDTVLVVETLTELCDFHIVSIESREVIRHWKQPYKIGISQCDHICYLNLHDRSKLVSNNPFLITDLSHPDTVKIIDGKDPGGKSVFSHYDKRTGNAVFKRLMDDYFTHFYTFKGDELVSTPLNFQHAGENYCFIDNVFYEIILNSDFKFEMQPRYCLYKP